MIVMRISPDLLARIQDMFDDYHFLATEVEEAHGASFLRNDAAPTRDGNQVRRIRLLPDVGVDEFLAEVDRRFAHLPFRSVRVDPFTAPPALEARLLLDGFRTDTEIVMASDG